MSQSPDSPPDPSRVGDLAELVDLLVRLRAWAGNPPYRNLAKQVGPLMRPPRVLSHTTLAHAFQPGRRRIDLDLVVAIVRALGLDESAADRWRAAWFRVQGAAKTGGPAGVFRQLPADLATFTGRADDLAMLFKLTAATESGAGTAIRICAIDGMAGVGKTQLAVHAAHRLVRAGRYLDGQLYVNLRGFDDERPPADPSAVLEGFLRQLGVPAQQIPEETDGRAAMFRDRLHDKNVLVLLDNAADERQVRDLIPAGPGCLVLITSRRSLAGLDGAHLLSLDVFSAGEALDLLARVVGAERVAAEPDAAAAIVAQCGCLPLGVALVAARLRSRPTWSLAGLQERLDDHLLAELVAGERGIAAAFALSYRHLTDEQRRMFRLLGLHPGADIDVSAAAAVAGLDRRGAERLLEALLDANLLQQRVVGRYSFHDLLRVYARNRLRAETSEPDRTTATTRLLGYYLASAANADRCLNPARQDLTLDPAAEFCAPMEFPDQPAAWQWCDTEYGNLLAAVRLAADSGRHAVCWQLPVVLSTYFRHRARRHDWVSALQIGLDSADALDDRAARTWVLARLAIACTELGLLHEALDHYPPLLAMLREAGDRQGEHAALTNRAVTHALLDQPEKALEGLEQALRVQRLIGHRPAQGITLANLGKIHLRLGNPDQAIACCQEAMEIYEETGQHHLSTNAFNTIGEAHRELGRLTEAEAFHLRALAASRDLGARAFEAGSLVQLGRTMRRKGDLAAAIDYFSRAHVIYVDIADPMAGDVLAMIEDCRS